MLTGNSAHIQPTTSRFDSLTGYSTEGEQCQPAIQHTHNPRHRGRIHLHSTTTKESSVSRQLSTQTANPFHRGRIHLHPTADKGSNVSRQLSTHTVTPLYRDWIRIPSTAAKESKVSRKLKYTKSTPSRSDSLTACGC